MAAKSLIDVLYKEAMEKEALRAWKANFGNLSMEGIKKLEDSGVLNRTKELKGLNLGTNRILQKSNAKNIPNLEHAVSMRTEHAKSLISDDMIDEYTVPLLKDKFRSDRMFSSPMETPQMGLRGFTSVPRHTAKHLDNMAQNSKNLMSQYGLGDAINPPTKIPRKHRESKKWVDAIIRRHEADEVRYGQKAYSDKNNFVNFGSGPRLKNIFFSHMSPDIILNESGHTALAPQKAKEYLTGFRNIQQGDSSEAPFLKEHMNFDYGKSPVVTNKQRKNINKQYDNYVNESLKNMGLI